MESHRLGLWFRVLKQRSRNIELTIKPRATHKLAGLESLPFPLDPETQTNQSKPKPWFGSLLAPTLHPKPRSPKPFQPQSWGPLPATFSRGKGPPSPQAPKLLFGQSKGKPRNLSRTTFFDLCSELAEHLLRSLTYLHSPSSSANSSEKIANLEFKQLHTSEILSSVFGKRRVRQSPAALKVRLGSLWGSGVS